MEKTVTSYISIASCLAPPSPSVVTYTSSNSGLTVYITSTISAPMTAQPEVITYTSIEGGSTLYITSTLPPQTMLQSASPSTVTVYLTQTQTVLASQGTSASNGSQQLSSSGAAPTAPIAQITSVVWQAQTTLVGDGSATCQALATTTLISYITSTGYPGLTDGGSISTTEAAFQLASAMPFGLASTTASAASAQSCPETSGPPPSALTLTSTAYPQTCAANTTQPAVTSYVYPSRSDSLSCAANASISTVTLTQAGLTSFLMASATTCPSPLPPSTITTYLGGTAQPSDQPSAAPNSVATMAASTIYACPPGASGSYTAGLQLYTQTFTSYIYSTMDSSICPAMSDVSPQTVTSFIYRSGNSTWTMSPTNGTVITERETYVTTVYGTGSAAQTVTSYIAGGNSTVTVLAGNGSLATLQPYATTTVYGVSTVTSFGVSCSPSTAAMSTWTVVCFPKHLQPAVYYSHWSNNHCDESRLYSHSVHFNN